MVVKPPSEQLHMASTAFVENFSAAKIARMQPHLEARRLCNRLDDCPEQKRVVNLSDGFNALATE